MINPSSFLRRALFADAIFSGIAALGFTFGASAFASLFNLPEVFLREVGLFLIAYAAFVGWLGTRQTMMKALVLLVIVGNTAWTLGSIALLFSGSVALFWAWSWWWRRRSPPACSPSCSSSACARAAARWRHKQHCAQLQRPSRQFAAAASPRR
jgi:hypothetical protein